MSTLTLSQILYARSPWSSTPSYPPPFAFLGPSAQPLAVVDQAGMALTAMSGVNVSFLADLSGVLGPAGLISNASVWLAEGTGTDPWPQVRLLHPPSIIPANGRPRQAVRQYFMDLISGGEYVAILSTRTAAGEAAIYSAPFRALGSEGDYLFNDDLPPRILLDDDDNPLHMG